MIASLTGKVAEINESGVVIDITGVGYDVKLSPTSLANVRNVGDDIHLYIYTNVREDALELYGFFSKLEKEIFLLLKSVSGIGSKTALSITSSTNINDLLTYINMENVPAISSVPGIGKKTAQRIVIELKGKINKISAYSDTLAGYTYGQNQYVSDAISALSNLGYKRTQIDEAITSVKISKDMKTEEIVRLGLKRLSR